MVQLGLLNRPRSDEKCGSLSGHTDPLPMDPDDVDDDNYAGISVKWL